MALTDDVIGALQVLAKPDGVRVTELCRALPHATSHEVEAALQRLLRLGQVRRNDLKGTWRLAGATASTPPSPPTLGPTRTSLPKGTDVRPQEVALPVVEDRGIPTECDEEGVIDASQREVIRDNVSARQVVAAGPGFGKTAVACGRVARLLREGVEPSHILLLSFTRTAVREMRARIAALAKDIADANAVEVRTIDSFMWRLRTGFTESASDGKGYAESIDDAAAMFDALTPDARDYFDRFAHVVVDEAQDLVGSRAQLVVKLLRRLSPTAGWTVFLDPAQAIYEWSDEEGRGGAPQATFAELLATLNPTPIKRELRHLHRTRDGGLRALLLGARRLVLDAPDTAYPRLRACLDARAAGEPLPVMEAGAGLLAQGCTSADTLVLLRRRAEVMELSAQLSKSGIAHRLRFGGLPHLGAPWVAPVLNQAFRQADSLRVTERNVLDAWQAIAAANSWLLDGWDPAVAWQLLRRHAGRPAKTIDIGAIATRLSSPSLPDDVSRRELGGAGPILSTVHGSKGRESPHALLLLTPQHDEGAEEARVLYVGLSRAKERFDVRAFRGSRWSCLEDTGRACHRSKTGNQRVELGRAGDFDLFRTLTLAGPVLEQQQRTLASFDGSVRPTHITTSEATQWIRHATSEGDPTPLAALSRGCEHELLQVARRADPKAHTPSLVRHLRWFDVGSVGLAGEAAANLELPEPWNTTRLFLMPVILGPGVIFGAKHE